jgi:predicted chitinase
MKKAMEFYKFTPERAAHFFAQTAHESQETLKHFLKI